MLHRQYFLKMQEEDDVVQSILTNECIVARDIVESFVLKLCTYEDCVYPANPEIIEKLLPSEVATSLVLEVSMVELTTTM